MTREEMDQLTEGLASKAAKVRALNEAGVSTGDIGRYLGIRYQHVYNVLLRAGVIEKPEANAHSTIAPGGDGPIVVGRINSKGAIELPSEVMTQYGLTAGTPVYCRALPEGLVLLSQEAAQRAVAEVVREKAPEQAALLEALFNLNVGRADQSPDG